MNKQYDADLEELLEYTELLLESIAEFGDEPMLKEIKENAYSISSKLNEMFEEA